MEGNKTNLMLHMDHGTRPGLVLTGFLLHFHMVFRKGFSGSMARLKA